MRHRNGKTFLTTAFFGTALFGTVLLAATSASAAESGARRYHDEASAEQIEKGNFVLARRPDAELPDYCLEQEATLGYCEVAQEDVESVFYKQVPSQPARLWGW